MKKEIKEKIIEILKDYRKPYKATERYNDLYVNQLLELFSQEKEKLLERIRLKPVKRNVPSKDFVDDYYMGFNQAIEDQNSKIEEAVKKI